MTQRAIWWIRRDFRLTDNTALIAALNNADEVIPLFVFDEVLTRSQRVRGVRLAWMLDALRVLSDDLAVRGSQLLFRRSDDIPGALVQIAQKTQANAVFFHRDYGSYARKRDERVHAALQAIGIGVHDVKDLIIHEMDEVKSKTDKLYEVYTPYRNAWLDVPKPPAQGDPTSDSTTDQIKINETTTKMRGKLIAIGLASGLQADTIPSAESLNVALPDDPIAQPGEAHALKRLEYFADRLLYNYGDSRNTPAEDGTAVISMYLHWGMLSPRAAYHTIMDALASTHRQDDRENAMKWISELVWREFNYSLLARFPDLAKRNYRREYDGLQWENDVALFEAWQTGRTGYPIVDAGMRQLNTRGWMHNRLRLITSSFLIKDLLIDWRWGETYFMNRLLDGDLANNAGNWQWSAGTGTDAAPYFRIFNPTTQGQKFDGDGAYIRQYVPELKDVPGKFIHEPSRMSAAQQEQYRCVIGHDYPRPIVDHAIQRKRALELYENARRGR